MVTLLSSAAVAALVLIPDAARAQSSWTGATSDYNTSTNWTNSTVPASGGQSAIFAGTGSTSVNVSSPVSPDSWTFNSSSQSYTITGSAVTFGTATGIVDNASGQTISIANNIGGVGGVAVNDATGTLILTGANTFGGATSIASGATLQVGNGGATGTLGSGNVTNNGTLIFHNSNYVTIANAVSGSGSVTFDGAYFLTGNSTYTGGTTISSGAIQIGLGGTTGSITGNVTDNGTISFNRSDNITFAGNIMGTGIVQISGGMVTLTGSNSYAGPTYVYSNVAISSDSNLGTGDVVLGTITFDAGFTSTHNYPIAGSGTFDTNGNIVTLSGAVENQTGATGSLIKAGAGTLILTGSNTYTGGTVINAGTLQVGNGGTTGNISAANVTDSGTLTFDHSDTVTFSNTISGAGNLEQLGTGTLVLTGNNSYSGTTTIDNGATLQVGNGGATGSLGSSSVTNNGSLVFNIFATVSVSNPITGSGSVTVGGNDLLVLRGTNTYTGSTTINAGSALQIGLGDTSGSITGNVLDNGVLSFNRSDNITFSGNISGSGQLTQGGSAQGLLTLTGNNTYSGFTNVEGGRLAISSDSNIGMNDVILIGGTIVANASFTSTHNYQVLAGNGGFFDTNGNTLTLAGVVKDYTGGGSGSLTKLGAGTLILTGNNSYSGTTTISAGTLQLGDGSIGGIGKVGSGNVIDNGTLAANLGLTSTVLLNNVISGSGNLTKSGVGTLILGGNNTYSGTTTINGGTIIVGNGTGGTLGSGDVVNNGALAFNRSNSITVANNISGTGGITDNGFGLLILTGTNTYSGQTISAGGSIQIGAGGTTGSLGTGDVVLGGLANLTINRSNALTVAGNISGNGSLTLAGTGTLILTNTNTYSGGTTVSAGILQVGSGGTSGALGSGNITDNATLAFDRSDNLTLPSNISGTGGISQMGSGTLTVSSAQSYTGATSIASGGTLALSGSGSIASSSGVADNGSFDITGITASSTPIKALTGNGTVYLGTKELIISGGSGTFTGGINGNGGLEISGGSTTFAGSVSGNVTVDSGATLQIGNGGTTGVVTGNVTDNGTAVLDRSDNITVSNLFTGTGILVQAGSGTLVLTSGNSYGATVINSGGILQVGNGGTTGTLGTGAIIDNGVLAFDHSDALTLPTGITGSGGVSQLGSGTLTISSAQTYSGATTIASGSTLALSGSGNIASASGVADNGTFDISGITAASTTIKALSGSGIVNLGTKQLIINAGSGAFTGSFNGAGALELSGGTTTLTSLAATNIAVDAGATLQLGNGGACACTLQTGRNALPPTITNNGALVYDFSDTFTISTVISGAGSLTLGGTGTVFVTGTNTYSGATTINTGATVEIGNGGTSGSLGTAAITDNGALGFDHSDTVTLGNPVSGTGGLTQSGTGTLILTGTNIYSGMTTITANGTLQVGNGGTSGSLGTGAVTNNGALTFNRSDTVTISNVISGAGGLTQSGGGTLILDSASTFTGTTTVASGILEIGDATHPNASVGGSVNVTSGGTLYGHGTVRGAVNVASGGALRPGGSIGTLTVNGNLTLPTGSTFVAELSPTAADQVNVGGNAALGGNLQLIADPGTYAAGTDFKLISATSVSGTFASVSGQVSGFTNTLQYSATGVDLILSSPAAAPTTFLFGSYGTTPNQIAAGNALTAASPSSALYAALGALVGSNTAAVPGALGQLAGDIRPSLRAAAIEDSRVIRDTLLDHLDHDGDGTTVWGAGLVGYGRLASDGNAANLHHDSAGFIAGLDMPVLPDIRLGVEGGYTSNSARTPGSISAASGDSGHIGAYASFNPGDVRLAVGGDYGFGSVTINRTLPQLGLATSASQDQQTGQVFADLGYRVALDGLALEPHAQIAHIIATGGAFTETGSIAVLSGNEKSDSATYTVLGARADLAEMALGDDMTLAPHLDLGWQHALAQLTPYQTVSYVNADTSFSVLGTPLAQNAAALQAGFDLKVSPSATLFLSYDGSFSSTVENHAFRGGLSWRF